MLFTSPILNMAYPFWILRCIRIKCRGVDLAKNLKLSTLSQFKVYFTCEPLAIFLELQTFTRLAIVLLILVHIQLYFHCYSKLHLVPIIVDNISNHSIKSSSIQSPSKIPRKSHGNHQRIGFSMDFPWIFHGFPEHRHRWNTTGLRRGVVRHLLRAPLPRQRGGERRGAGGWRGRSFFVFFFYRFL